MQIEKINENQLEIILNLEDLKKNNISLHSFMCNSIKSQNLCFNILGLITQEIDFSVKNYEIVIDSFAVPVKNSFVLIVTRIPKVSQLHIYKTKYNKFKAHKSFWLKFDNFENFCMLCNSLNNKLNAISSLYLLNNCYFLHVTTNNFKDYFKILSITSEFSTKIYTNNFILDENAEIIIKNSAIQTTKKYFI